MKIKPGWHLAMLKDIFPVAGGLNVVYGVESDGYYVWFNKSYPMSEEEDDDTNNEFRNLCLNFDLISKDKDENEIWDVEKLYSRKVAVKMIVDKDGNFAVGEVTKYNAINMEGRCYE